MFEKSYLSFFFTFTKTVFEKSVYSFISLIQSPNKSKFLQLISQQIKIQTMEIGSTDIYI